MQYWPCCLLLECRVKQAHSSAWQILKINTQKAPEWLKKERRWHTAGQTLDVQTLLASEKDSCNGREQSGASCYESLSWLTCLSSMLKGLIILKSLSKCNFFITLPCHRVDKVEIIDMSLALFFNLVRPLSVVHRSGFIIMELQSRAQLLVSFGVGE